MRLLARRVHLSFLQNGVLLYIIQWPVLLRLDQSNIEYLVLKSRPMHELILDCPTIHALKHLRHNSTLILKGCDLVCHFCSVEIEFEFMSVSLNDFVFFCEE